MKLVHSWVMFGLVWFGFIFLLDFGSSSLFFANLRLSYAHISVPSRGIYSLMFKHQWFGFVNWELKKRSVTENLVIHTLLPELLKFSILGEDWKIQILVFLCY